MNWKALGLSVLTMTGIGLVIWGLSWLGSTYGAEYALFPLPILGGLVIFYLMYD